MDVLVVDLTHGGVTIAIKLAELNYFNNIYAYDLYGTLKNQNKRELLRNNIIIIGDVCELNKNSNELLISYPIHSPLKPSEIREKIKWNNGLNLTHHKTVQLILKQWKKRIKKEKIAIIEVTGVKGKTSTVSLLKSILKDYNPLVLTSLGASLTLNNETISLKKNISINPASILQTVELADNIIKQTSDDLVIKRKDDYKIAIFESSLGTTGFGDIGILTNIIENYKIAKNISNAQIAKEQVFNNEYVVIDYYTLINFYPGKIGRDKLNSFKLKDDNDEANLIATKIKYDFETSKIEVKYTNIKTIHGNELNGELTVETFAFGEHHVLNVLGAITAALTLEIDEKTIKEGLKGFKPVGGRSSIQFKDNIKIIEEINPGLNVKAIEKTFDAFEDLSNYSIILGGKYGVTCEEINEFELSKVLDELIYEQEGCDLILVDELGENIVNKMENKVKFINDYIKAQEIAIKKGKDIIFIYRSNYSQINKR
ncbi:MAG: coenzyme F430 synthase [Methanobrevibacter sp.]|jgi:UDP-N-acetylmuramyl pentapeptide synthase|nr:coenzyme F430 synthase [Candidatus Methanovirga meridionalis]